MSRRAPLIAGGLLFALLATGCGVRPTDVINGRPAVSGPAEGTGIYLLSQGQVVLAIRSMKPPSPPLSLSPAETLALLAQGPTESERSAGITSDVPTDLVPANVGPTADGNGVTVTVASAVKPLSPLAVDQIACTVADALARSAQGRSFAPVTLAGPDGTRPARTCPVT
ncbi:hypothetical protein ACWD6L_15845 [Micromonospora profundi]|uniref:GerMN domain-containing protein n=1 Tax=Micromonospora profundi TaxID=1420889 RepID=A0AAJ6L4E2_9ACTN|nr:MULTISPECIES: hypothetical protein [Micromonospora]WLS44443.1 hypothetical protein Q3V37_24110 [Micromonospora profundi]